jgi:hypothetical protein
MPSDAPPITQRTSAQGRLPERSIVRCGAKLAAMLMGFKEVIMLMGFKECYNEVAF